MRNVSTLDELRSARLSLDGTVGFVPTMGYLHEGHLSLIRRAREECDHVLVSIFVNPTQFGPKEDLSKYPRDLDRDFQTDRTLHRPGLDAVRRDHVSAGVPDLGGGGGDHASARRRDETRSLPRGDNGGRQVVQRRPAHKAYFGQKDAQQAAVIRQMTRDLNFPIEIVVCPIVREADGLAMSSRNVYLDPEQRKAATVLFRALSAAKELYEAGERNAEKLRGRMKEVLAGEPLADVQYVSCADYDTLEELDRDKGKNPALAGGLLWENEADR
jgi:pantoate--beta-alanine ligase